MDKDKTIALVGGHLTPALAVLDELQKGGHTDILWIGVKYTMSGDKNPSAEYNVVSGKNVPFVELTAGKLYTSFNLKTLIAWIKIPLGIFHALMVLIRTNPKLVIAFGGYVAVPVAIAAKILGIPFVTHEQTVTQGKANQLVARFANKVFLSWKKYFLRLSRKNPDKYVFTGNPVRQDIFEVKTDKFRFENKKPTIYITGGNQGAHALNEMVKEVLPTILKKYNVIHQTGTSSLYNDYDDMKEFAKTLTPELRGSYIVQTGFWGEEIGAVFDSSDFLVTRSGANTVSELLALGIKAILIPLPSSALDEQTKNAMEIVELGLGVLLEQETMTAETFLLAIEEANSKKVSEDQLRLARETVNLDAAKTIVEEAIKLVDSK